MCSVPHRGQKRVRNSSELEDVGAEPIFSGRAASILKH